MLLVVVVVIVDVAVGMVIVGKEHGGIVHIWPILAFRLLTCYSKHVRLQSKLEVQKEEGSLT